MEIQEKCLIGVDDMDVYRLEDGVCRDLPHLAGNVIEDGRLLAFLDPFWQLAIPELQFLEKLRDRYAGRCGTQLCDQGVQFCRSENQVFPVIVTWENMYICAYGSDHQPDQRGDHAYLRIGSRTIKDVPEGEKQFGNPAESTGS